MLNYTYTYQLYFWTNWQQQTYFTSETRFQQEIYLISNIMDNIASNKYQRSSPGQLWTLTSWSFLELECELLR